MLPNEFLKAHMCIAELCRPNPIRRRSRICSNIRCVFQLYASLQYYKSASNPFCLIYLNVYYNESKTIIWQMILYFSHMKWNKKSNFAFYDFSEIFFIFWYKKFRVILQYSAKNLAANFLIGLFNSKIYSKSSGFWWKSTIGRQLIDFWEFYTGRARYLHDTCLSRKFFLAIKQIFSCLQGQNRLMNS